jgi:hypothetical protein
MHPSTQHKHTGKLVKFQIRQCITQEYLDPVAKTMQESADKYVFLEKKC